MHIWQIKMRVRVLTVRLPLFFTRHFSMTVSSTTVVTFLGLMSSKNGLSFASATETKKKKKKIIEMKCIFPFSFIFRLKFTPHPIRGYTIYLCVIYGTFGISFSDYPQIYEKQNTQSISKYTDHPTTTTSKSTAARSTLIGLHIGMPARRSAVM